MIGCNSFASWIFFNMFVFGEKKVFQSCKNFSLAKTLFLFQTWLYVKIHCGRRIHALRIFAAVRRMLKRFFFISRLTTALFHRKQTKKIWHFALNMLRRHYNARSRAQTANLLSANRINYLPQRGHMFTRRLSVCLSLSVCLLAISHKTADEIIMKILPETYWGTRKNC